MEGRDSNARGSGDVERGDGAGGPLTKDGFFPSLRHIGKKKTIPKLNEDEDGALAKSFLKVHYPLQPMGTELEIPLPSKDAEIESPLPARPITIDIIAISNGNEEDWVWKGNSAVEEKGAKKLSREEDLFYHITNLIGPNEEKKIIDSKTLPSTTIESETKVKDVAAQAAVQPLGLNWLAHPTMLPSSMRQARIMEFRYPSKSGDFENIEKTANHFLQCLSKSRQKFNNRPVIFIAHGYGGLVLEKALVLDKARLHANELPQFIRLRHNAERISNPQTGSMHLNGQLATVPESDSHINSREISAPNTLHDLSVVAGAIFMDTKTDDPGNSSEFHRRFLSLIVEWDIPVRWYCSSQQRNYIEDQAKRKDSNGVLFDTCEKDHRTPRLCTFSESGKDSMDGSLNKFSEVGDENYSRVRRDIRTMFRDDRFLEEVYKGTLNSKNLLDKMLKRLDPSEPKRYGNMALHIYSRLGHEKALATLLENDVDLTAKTEKPDPKAGQTALRIAVEHRRLEIVRLLLQKGAPSDHLDKEMRIILSSVEESEKNHALSESEKGIVTKIRDILTTRNLIEGPLGHLPPSEDPQAPLRADIHLPLPSDKHKELKLEYPALAPNPHGIRACKEYRICITDFFIKEELSSPETKSNDTQVIPECREYRTIKSCTVQDVLYTKALDERHKSNLEDTKRKLGELKAQFTWYHVPSNNLSWVQGLLVKLRLQQWFRQGAVESKADAPHSHFLQPKVSKFEGASSTKIPFVTLFTPFLSIEQYKSQKLITEAVSTARHIHQPMENVQEDGNSSMKNESLFNDEALTGENLSADQHLLYGYTYEEKGIHVRRTLAQSYYPMLPDTKKLDRNQALIRYTKSNGAKPIVMVDQLWIYILGDKLITSFPLTWGQIDEKGGGPDMLDFLLKYLRKRKRQPILSIFDLASIIIKRCTGLVAVEHERLPQKYDLLATYSKAIGNLANKEATLFKKFGQNVKELARLRSLNEEGARFDKRIKGLEYPPEDSMTEPSESESEDNPSDAGSTDSEDDAGWRLRPPPKISSYKSEILKMKQKKIHKKWERSLSESFNNIAKETTKLIAIKDIKVEIDMVIAILNSQQGVINDFEAAIPTKMKATEHTEYLKVMLERGGKKLSKLKYMSEKSQAVETALDHLLNLKQKQANASEARNANKLANETGRQGKTLNLFTAVTIVFLPASFMTTFLTIPIADYPHDDQGASAISLRWASKYIFSISFSISIPLLIIAFNFAVFEGAYNKLREKPKAAIRVLSRFFSPKRVILGNIFRPRFLIFFSFYYTIVQALDFMQFIYHWAVSILLFALQQNKIQWHRRNRKNASVRRLRKRKACIRIARILGLW